MNNNELTTFKNDENTSLDVQNKPPSRITEKEEKEISMLSDSVEGKYASITDKLLSSHKVADAGVLGDQLNSLVLISKEYDPSRFQKKGLLSKLSNFFTGVKEQVLAHSDTVNERIERIVVVMNKEIDLHEKRQYDLDELMLENQQYHSSLTQNIKKAESLIEALIVKKENVETHIDDENSFASVDVMAIQNQLNRVRALKEEFENNRLRSKQVALEIESMKQSGVDLIQTVKTAKGTLIPTWKSVLLQFIIANEQEKTGKFKEQLNNSMDEATALLGKKISENRLRSAELINTQTFSIERLESLNNELINTSKKVKEKQIEAEKQQIENAKKREELTANLMNSIRN